jgi:preprotein translocase subunit SecB
VSSVSRYTLKPFFANSGVYLSDLTFIADGNPDMLRNNEQLINFSKRMKTAEVIRDLQQYQTVPYAFQKVHELQSWLDVELANSSEIQELYELSTQVEPREREDEKMYASNTLVFANLKCQIVTGKWFLVIGFIYLVLFLVFVFLGFYWGYRLE